MVAFISIREQNCTNFVFPSDLMTSVPKDLTTFATNGELIDFIENTDVKAFKPDFSATLSERLFHSI